MSSMTGSFCEVTYFLFCVSSTVLTTACLQVKAPESRANFSSEDFAAKYDLGGPLAILFFKAQHERGEHALLDKE